MGKSNKSTDQRIEQNPHLTADVCDELLELVKETAHRIEDRMKKVCETGTSELVPLSGDTQEMPKLETKQSPAPDSGPDNSPVKKRTSK